MKPASGKSESLQRLPPWLKRRIPAGGQFQHTHHAIGSLGIETICTNARCPNIGECWSKGTATVLILGNICTRNCGFCSVATGRPLPPDKSEPQRVAELAKRLNLKYIVITSVDRDDLPDGGAGQFTDVINEVRRRIADMHFELLVPDFRDCQDSAINILSQALPFVFGHNVETVPSLYSKARPGGNYERSLLLLKKAKDKWPDIQTKSSIMLGLGETDDEVEQVLKDLRNAGCDRIAIGQYLQPSGCSLEVVEYIEPGKFELWRKLAAELGFSWVMSGPFVRSSYHAEEPPKELR